MDIRVQLIFAVVAGAATLFATAAPSATIADFYELAKPAGDGPFPAVVLAPGCGGFHDQYSPPVFDQYRKRFVEEGFVVANVDSQRATIFPRATPTKACSSPRMTTATTS